MEDEQVFETGGHWSMPTRWEVERAMFASSLDAPSRLIVLTLLALSDADTAVVPEQWGPSLTALSQKTGLGRSTAASKLNELEASGWVSRDRPAAIEAWSKKSRTRYSLHIGTSPAPGLVQDVDQSTSPAPGPVLVPELDQSSVGTSPGAGHVVKPTTPTTSRPTTSSEASPPKPKRAKAHKRAKHLEPTRLDVEQICNRLADRVEANGSKRPTVTETWRRDARLLLDTDGRDLQKVLNLIDWCQTDGFWRSNVLSMPTFRKKYDQLRLKALEEHEHKNGKAANGGYQPFRNPTDMSVYLEDL
jgi:hypothetical protein